MRHGPRAGGRMVVIPRGLELERGRLRQRFGGRLPSRWRARPRVGGREGSRPTALDFMGKWLFAPLVETAGAVGAVGIPGGWDGGGISNGRGKVRGEVVGGRSFPYPVSFHGPGGGRPPSPRQLPAVGRGTSRLACGPACRSGGAACGPACGSARYPAAPSPLPPLRISSLADGGDQAAKRNLARAPRLAEDLVCTTSGGTS